MRMMRNCFVLFAFFFVAFALVQAVGEDFYVEFFPEIPGPNTDVSAKVISYSFEVDRANITWTVNGQVKLRGTGEKNFSFETGNLGSVTNLVVSVVSSEGVKLTKNFSFRVADVDILWEAQNYTPMSYKGKALPVSGSLIKVTAVPYFPGSSSGLVYEWQIDYKNNPDISGTGKNSFTFRTADIYNTNKINVTVSNYDKSIVAKKNVAIEIGEPKVVFYEDNPLEGPQYNKALNREVQLEKEEIIVRAEPYFFSLRDLEKLSYQWLMNGEKVFPEEFPNLLSLRKSEGSGRALIEVKVSNPLNILQFGGNSLGINY